MIEILDRNKELEEIVKKASELNIDPDKAATFYGQMRAINPSKSYTRTMDYLNYLSTETENCN